MAAAMAGWPTVFTFCLQVSPMTLADLQKSCHDLVPTHRIMCGCEAVVHACSAHTPQYPTHAVRTHAFLCGCEAVMHACSAHTHQYPTHEFMMYPPVSIHTTPLLP